MAGSMDLVFIHGRMDQGLLVIGIRISCRGLVFMNGWMAEAIKDIGIRVIWMDLERMSGKMVANTKVNILTIKNTAMVFSNGMMVDSMLDIGPTATNTASASTPNQQKTKPNTASGKMANSSNGSPQTKSKILILDIMIIQNCLRSKILLIRCRSNAPSSSQKTS